MAYSVSRRVIVIAWFSCLSLKDQLGLCLLNCHTHSMTGNCSASQQVLVNLLWVVSVKRGNPPLFSKSVYSLRFDAVAASSWWNKIPTQLLSFLFVTDKFLTLFRIILAWLYPKRPNNEAIKPIRSIMLLRLNGKVRKHGTASHLNEYTISLCSIVMPFQKHTEFFGRMKIYCHCFWLLFRGTRLN